MKDGFRVELEACLAHGEGKGGKSNPAVRCARGGTCCGLGEQQHIFTIARDCFEIDLIFQLYCCLPMTFVKAMFVVFRTASWVIRDQQASQRSGSPNPSSEVRKRESSGRNIV